MTTIELDRALWASLVFLAAIGGEAVLFVAFLAVRDLWARFHRRPPMGLLKDDFLSSFSGVK